MVLRNGKRKPVCTRHFVFDDVLVADNQPMTYKLKTIKDIKKEFFAMRGLIELKGEDATAILDMPRIWSFIEQSIKEAVEADREEIADWLKKGMIMDCENCGCERCLKILESVRKGKE